MLSTTRNLSFCHTHSTHRSLFRAAVVILVSATPFAAAQAPGTRTFPANLVATNLSLELTDSPGSLVSSSLDTADTPANPGDPQTPAFPSPPPPNTRTKHSAHLEITIAPNEIAEPMPVHEKIVGGVKNSVSLFSATGWVASAGLEQLFNDSPNYGTDKGAFGRRLGASAIRHISEDIFADCLFAPVFHEDPRYYIMGRGNNFFKRAIYAATRTIVTRTDSGRTTPNFALLAGAAASAAITVTYYPAKNTTFSEAAQTFGGSLGGNAVGFVVTEFVADALQYAHLKKRD
jgi:hypothetical protein